MNHNRIQKKSQTSDQLDYRINEVREVSSNQSSGFEEPSSVESQYRSTENKEDDRDDLSIFRSYQGYQDVEEGHSEECNGVEEFDFEGFFELQEVRECSGLQFHDELEKCRDGGLESYSDHRVLKNCLDESWGEHDQEDSSHVSDGCDPNCQNTLCLADLLQWKLELT